MNFNEWDGVFYDAVIANAIINLINCKFLYIFFVHWDLTFYNL